MTMLAQFAAAAGGVAPAYIEDMFSTYLYTGNGVTQTINNGIDLAGKGGLTWFKSRASVSNHFLFDSARGTNKYLRSQLTNAEGTSTSDWISSFNSNGFSLGSNAFLNTSSESMVNWTFRKQPKFFDVVTYTGDGAFGRTINHSLASIPGCVIIKRLDTSSEWLVWHQTDYFGAYYLNQTYAKGNWLASSAGITDTTMRVDGGAGPMPGGVTFDTNASGGTYVAYLFAHNAGGFGLSGNENVVSCGSYTGTGGALSVSLGYEPQLVIIKPSSTTGDWQLIDNMRGWTADGVCQRLEPNTSDAEATSGAGLLFPTATGFGSTTTSSSVNGSGVSYIYIAIRRGPMKVPTDGTKVFLPNDGTGSTSGQIISTSFPVDLAMSAYKTQGYVGLSNDRLRGIGNTNTAGATPALQTSTTQAESAFSGSNPWFINAWNNSVTRGSNAADPSGGIVTWLFGRAPSFFDEVCYTGTGANRTVTHNLAAVPELMIVKNRVETGGENWTVYSSFTTATKALLLNDVNAAITASVFWNNTTPTSTVFSVGTAGNTNTNAQAYVAYLFATCAGVSKVGSYTGTGTTQAINCGFTAGARFVLIKRTDSTGDWYVWDSARGIVAGNDPYLLLNSTAAEVTSTDYVDTSATGFELTSTAPAAINASGGSYIFLAVA